MTDRDVVVLRQEVHGRPIENYVEALRERLPDREIRLARTPEQEQELVADASVVTGLQMDEALLDRAESLELFACLYAGVGHLPTDAFEERGIAVTNASGVHGPNISEYVLGSLLTFARGLHRGWQRQQRREWRHFQTRELHGSTVTVVGLGAIGTTVVDRLEPFDVDTVGVRYSPEKGGPTDEVVGFEDVHAACVETDYLVLACPLTETTEGLIDGAVFETLPPDAVLVNVARGPVVETDALVEALRGNGIRGAALDVTDPEPLPEDHPLWTLSNVLVTPHNSGDTPEYYERVADILAENLQQIDETGDYGTLRNRAV
ncbi:MULTISPECIES: D-2-hydroxyacid dehydrogenase [Salinibaculum]|uniref:D-2-hydroxyacid dehydrogenase n=1 Tax=Salinibaculum TaxID=2732368 RepID=UPI0030D4D2B3